MRILFTHSYFLSLDPKQKKAARPYPPLGTLYAATLARSLGHQVSVYDVQFDADEKGLLQHMRDNKPDLLVFWDDGFNYLTKMCLSNMREVVLHTLHAIKGDSVPVWISSSDSSDHPDVYLHAGAEVILKGEGEETLRELLHTFPNHYEVPGIASSKGSTPARKVMRQLDELPAPDFSLIPLQPYRDRWMKAHGFFSLNLVTTRGCPFSCNWCAKPIYGNRYNAHSPAYTVSQLKNLLAFYQPDHLWFADDIFGLRPNWVQEFSELMKKEGLSIPFTIQSRVDLLLKEDTVECLARAGCRMVWVGAESGSQKILDAMDKGTRVEQIAEATLLLKKYGIQVGYFLQFGYPGESWEDIQLTLNMLMNNRPDDIGVSVSYPLPGTAFYENVKNEMKQKQRWTDSDDLALMFHNTYRPVFYKTLHRYLHKNFRKAQTRRLLQRIENGTIPVKKLFPLTARYVYYSLVTPLYKWRWYAHK